LKFKTKLQPKIILTLLLVFTIVAPFIWLFLGVPELNELNSGFSYRAEINSVDNFFDQQKNVYMGETNSVSNFYTKFVSGDSEKVTLQNGFEVFSPENKTIFKVDREYQIDAHTKTHVPSLRPNYRNGYLFGPRMKGILTQEKDKASFTYWHPNYDTSIKMDFRGEELIYGLRVYRYESNFTVDQTNDLKNIPYVGKSLGISLDVNLQTWIEPYTGEMVKYEDQAEAFYYQLEDGVRIRPWNKFHNKYTEASLNEKVSQITTDRNLYILETILIPLVFAIAALVIGLYLLYFLLKEKYGENNQAVFIRIAQMGVPIIILIVCSSFSVFVFWSSKKLISSQIESEFFKESSGIELSIKNRLDIYTDSLKGAQSLFYSSENVTKKEWAEYVDNLDVQNSHPGIQGIGFATYINQKNLTQKLAHIRDNSSKDFKIFPGGNRDTFVPVVYLEPQDEKNKRAIGFDMYSEQTRRSAINFARDSNGISLSGKVTLVQENSTDTQPGFLIYLPVYKNRDTISNLVEKRQNIEGFVYAPFRMYDFMKGLLNTQTNRLKLTVYDSGIVKNTNESNLLYETKLNKKWDENLSDTRVIDFGGTRWVIKVNPEKNYGLDFIRQILPWAFLIVGMLLSILLYILLHTFNTRKIKAMELAKLMTSSLESAKAKDEAILTNIGEGILVTNKLGIIEYANDAALKMFECSNDELIGKKFYDALRMVEENGEQTPIDKRPIEQAIRTKKSVSSRKFYIDKKGKKFAAHLTITPVMVGGKLNGVIQTFRDVTQELAYINEIQKFQLAVENASDQIVIVDSEGNVLYANPATEKITGYTLLEIIGTKAGSLWGGLMENSFYENMWNTIKVKKKSFEGLIKNKRKNGEIYFADSKISPVLDVDNDVNFFVAIERDITKEIEVDKAKTEFVSLASHQLRTPLSAVNWFTEMLINGDAGKLNNEQRDYLDEIYRANNRMIDLVNALLDTSRIDMGTFAINPEKVIIKDIASTVLEELTPQLEQKKQKIKISIDSKIPHFEADPKLLAIIFQNFLTNAVKYSPPGSTIEFKCELNKQREIQISVKDRGYGIPDNQKDKIYSKLFRADNVRKKETEGTGLGLYIVKAIVEKSGGKTWFESIEKKGTTFYATFPIKGMKKINGEKGLVNIK